MSSNNKRPTMPKDVLQHKYDNFAPTYDKSQRILDYFGVMKLRRGLLRDVSGEILEVACGTGTNFPFFSTASRVTVIDISPGMMDVARQQAQKLQLQVEFHLMEAEKLDFPDNSFDTVVSTLTTCTFTDSIAALQEMKRVCRPDGRILLLEHGSSKLRIVRYVQDRFADWHFRNAGCRWNQEPRDIMKEAGLNITSVKSAFLGIFHAVEIAND